MHRIFQSPTMQSERNGTIEVRKWFGSVEVLVDGYTQSGRYLWRMWHQALLRLPGSQKVDRILMLGLGTGSAILAIHSCYPTAALTIVEWDPVMIELAAKHCCASELIRSTIVLGDVVDVLPDQSAAIFNLP
ncbi:MAG: hypothetical protein JNL58_02755 [Planctomyces sp.]|nr:hypothetical protein [Planctomyces sp.]